MNMSFYVRVVISVFKFSKSLSFGIIGQCEMLAEVGFCLVQVSLSSPLFIFSFLKHLHKVKS